MYPSIYLIQMYSTQNVQIKIKSKIQRFNLTSNSKFFCQVETDAGLQTGYNEFTRIRNSENSAWQMDNCKRG